MGFNRQFAERQTEAVVDELFGTLDLQTGELFENQITCVVGYTGATVRDADQDAFCFRCFDGNRDLAGAARDTDRVRYQVLNHS